MSDAELDVMAIEHRHLLLLGEGHGIALARVFLLRATVKDGFLAGRLDDQFGLEDPGRVAQFLGLLLAVDEEEGDAPEVVPLADEALNLDLWELRIGVQFSLPTFSGIASETASRWVRFQTSFLSPLLVVRVSLRSRW